MDNPSLNQLAGFISDHKLKNDKGIIHFEATVSFYKQDLLHRISSSIQIVTLPGELVLYIIEFIKDEYKNHEMYSTKKFLFSYYSFNLLEINNKPPGTDPLLFIELPAKSKVSQLEDKSGITQ